MPDSKRTPTGVLGGLAGLVGLSAVAGVLVTATVTPAIAVSGAAASSAITMFDNMPSYLEIDKLMLPTTIWYTDPATGQPAELTQFYDQNRSPVEQDQIAPVMYDAIISSEDPRYYQHGGVDLIGTTRAVLTNLRGSGQTQGGSSISQQYVKNILVQRCEADAATEEEKYNCWVQATTAAGNEGVQRKLQEMRYAIALEQKYSKNDILLGYLNIANFGGLNYGIDAAAKYYFGVSAGDLNLAQAATLAGIVQNPNSFRIDQPGDENNGAPNGAVEASGNQLAALDIKLEAGEITQEQYLAAADGYTLTKGRQLYVLSRMLEDGKITQAQYDEAVLAPITPNIVQPKTGCAAAGGSSYFCQYVVNTIKTDPAFGATEEERLTNLKRGGLNIYTSLDLRVQIPAEQAMTEWTPTKVDGMEFGSSAVSIEASTGRILSITQNTLFSEDLALTEADPSYTSLVYAGNQQYGNSIGFQAGSTFKLFTLLNWLEQGRSLNESLNGAVRPLKRITNSCEGSGDWVNLENSTINNYNRQSGYTGTVMSFTAQSLNSGYLAMAERLDLCDTANIAAKMGVTTGDGRRITMDTAFSVLGSDNVAPVTMAAAYATIANNGIYCTPRIIDRVTDSDGNERPVPASSCNQVLDPRVAATAAYALEGVMTGNGTGRASNPFDGIPILGKTGTAEEIGTWMVESTTKVTTAVWVGNTRGEVPLRGQWYNDVEFPQLRHQIAPRIQEAANSFYGGDDFPGADSQLTRQMLTDLPNVVGRGIDDAFARLEDAGFDAVLSDAIDSNQPEGTIAAQDPGAGRVAGGTTVTLYPSNGQALTVPDVGGQRPEQAVEAIRGAGFGNVNVGQCTVDTAAPVQGLVTGTSPGAGTNTNRNTAISVNYSRPVCP